MIKLVIYKDPVKYSQFNATAHTSQQTAMFSDTGNKLQPLTDDGYNDACTTALRKYSLFSRGGQYHVCVHLSIDSGFDSLTCVERDMGKS